MISALPGLLARTMADAIDNVADAGGLFAAPCRAVAGPALFADGDADAAVFVALGPLSYDGHIGAITAGEEIRLPFVAKVTLALAGPVAPALDNVTRDPSDMPVDWADLMLSVVMGHLQTAADAGRDAPLSRSLIRTATRKITAEWRFGQITQVIPVLVGSRPVWQIDATLEGVQVLSPVAPEGGIITRAELSGQVGATPVVATIQGGSEQLPLRLFVGIGPDNAERLASFDLVQVADLMRVPRAEIAAKATDVAAGDDALRDGLTVLHGLLMLRLDAVLGGLNAAFLAERHAALNLSDVWDGTTLTVPDDMEEPQRLRVQFMAGLLIRLIRPEAWDQVTLGQLSTLNAEGLG